MPAGESPPARQAARTGAAQPGRPPPRRQDPGRCGPVRADAAAGARFAAAAARHVARADAGEKTPARTRLTDRAPEEWPQRQRRASAANPMPTTPMPTTPIPDPMPAWTIRAGSRPPSRDGGEAPESLPPRGGGQVLRARVRTGDSRENARENADDFTRITRASPGSRRGDGLGGRVASENPKPADVAANSAARDKEMPPGPQIGAAARRHMGPKAPAAITNGSRGKPIAGYPAFSGRAHRGGGAFPPRRRRGQRRGRLQGTSAGTEGRTSDLPVWSSFQQGKDGHPPVFLQRGICSTLP